jgi:uncharacterized protein (DUF305 family)
MSLFRFSRPALAVAFATACASATEPPLDAAVHHAAAPPSGSSSESAAFLAENAAAMTKMMRDMTVQPTGDVDRDFVAMMVPHHQGAIDMAQAVLRYGKNETIRRLAQEIVIEQTQEIEVMHGIVNTVERQAP